MTDVLKELQDAITTANLIVPENILVDRTPDEDWNKETVIIISLENSEEEMSLSGPVLSRQNIAIMCLAKSRDVANNTGSQAAQIAAECLDHLFDNDRISGAYPTTLTCGPVSDKTGPKRDEFLFIQSFLIYL